MVIDIYTLYNWGEREKQRNLQILSSKDFNFNCDYCCRVVHNKLITSKYHCGETELLLSLSNCIKIGLFSALKCLEKKKKNHPGNCVSMINKMLNNIKDLQGMTPDQRLRFRNWEGIATDTVQQTYMYSLIFFK